MAWVLYCIGPCRQIIVNSDDSDTQGSGTFICDDCDKSNSANKSHPFFQFSQTEKQLKEYGGSWIKRPVEDVLP